MIEMKVIEAPNEVYSVVNEQNVKIFLAGGITNCPDWQQEFIRRFPKWGVTLYNPRRAVFDVTNPNEFERQVVWEHLHLEKSDIISFWFSRGSINPIVLFELGKYLRSGKKIFIGIDDEYPRRKDVEVQSKLMGYERDFFCSIKTLVYNIKEYVRSINPLYRLPPEKSEGISLTEKDMNSLLGGH